MAKRTKSVSPFRLEMDPDEALERFIGTKPDEVEALIKRGKKRKPPGGKRASGGNVQPDGVVDLRRRRMRKRAIGK